MNWLLLILIAFNPSSEGVEEAPSAADSLYTMALAAESETMYLTADTLYRSAHTAFLEEGDGSMADSCRYGSYRMQRICMEYPLTREQADSVLSERCPWLSASRRDSYFQSGMMDHMDYQGSRYYFSECVANLLFRNLDLMHEYGRRHSVRDPFYDPLRDIVLRPSGSGYPPVPWQPLINPMTFLVEGSMTIPRDELPSSGILRIWVPVPVQSNDQTSPRMVSVEPQELVVYPPTTDRDIGTVFLECLLDSLETDLTVSVTTLHTHYERRCLVDPDRVGEYDIDDPDYIRYTSMNANIVYTQEMERLAREITEGEDNPYLQARLLYEYVVENVPYSHVPHMTMLVLGIPESVFCHENGYGDCGTQSMYFSALCRSLGIPARACGGRQLVPGAEGSHFWAEFMVPEYGWVPVDVTVAETADWSWSMSEEEKDAFKEYFFGNLDPYRMVIQKDVNLIPSPEPGERLAMETAIQFPAMVCSGSMDDPSMLAAMHWNVRVLPVER